MSECQNSKEEKDQPNSRKRKADDRPPSSCASIAGSTASRPAFRPPSKADYTRYLSEFHPVSWVGSWFLKSEAVCVQMLYVSGLRSLARKALPPPLHNGQACLRIRQRMRLDSPELRCIEKKLQLKKEHCVLVALPCGTDEIEIMVERAKMQKYFIQYFEDKQAAGVVCVSYPKEPGYTIHFIPVGQYTNEKLEVLAPSLLTIFEGHCHILVIITTVTPAAQIYPPKESNSKNLARSS